MPPLPAAGQVIECTSNNLALDLTLKQLSGDLDGRGVRSIDGRLSSNGNFTVWRGQSPSSGDIVGFFINERCNLTGSAGTIRAFLSRPTKHDLQSCCILVEKIPQPAEKLHGYPVPGHIAGERTRRVNVRTKPSTRGQNIVAQMSGQEPLTVNGEGTGDYGEVWYAIRTGNDETGWIRGDLVMLDQDPNEAELLDARIGSIDGPSDWGWAGKIFDLVAAIDGCLSVTTAKPADVEFVEHRRSETVDVRLHDASDRRWRCLIGLSGGTPIRYDPLILAKQPAGEPIFVRSPTAPQSGICRMIEPVIHPETGNRLGWLIFDVCE